MKAPTKAGVKHDLQKPRWSLLPWRALSAVVAVLEHGARKYSPGGWMAVIGGAGGEQRYADALERHLVAWRLGERVDPDSGLPTLALVATNALFLLAKEVGFDHPQGSQASGSSSSSQGKAREGW